MSRAAIGFVLAALVAHALLALGLLAGVPAPVRLAVAFGVLVVLPGAAWLRLIGSRVPGGPWLAAGWALGFGAAWNAIAILVLFLFGVPFTAWTGASGVASAVLWLGAARRTRDPGGPAPAVLSRRAAAVILLAAALAGAHVARFGSPATYYSDTPAHVASLRRMSDSANPFPSDAFYRDAAETGSDPRKALWHPQVVLIARLAGVDVYDAWRMLSACVTPVFVLNVAAFGFLLAGPAGAVTGAWAFLLTYGGSAANAPLRETVFPSKMADQLALATAVAVLADLRERTRASRLSAVGLGLAAVFTHLFPAIQFAVVFTALGVGLLFRDRRWTPELSRLTVTVLAVAVACAPFLLLRASQAYAPQNVLHTEPQGLLILWPGAEITSIGILWRWMGLLWVLFPLTWWAIWKWGRGNAAVLMLLTTSVGVTLLIFNPLAVAVLQPKLAYLLMRMIWMVPLYGLLAWILPSLFERLREASGRARLAPAVSMAGVLVLAAPALSDAASAIRHPERIRREELASSPERWRSELAWIDDAFEPGQVILSDPGTSYSIPMFTRHYVVTLLDQHSSPNDPHAVQRLLDARDALDPYGSWDRLREVVHRYVPTLIVLNGRFDRAPHFDFWGPSPRWYRAARARLDRHPDVFEPVRTWDRFAVYRIHPAALDTLSAPMADRPFVEPFQPGRHTIARRTGEALPGIHWVRFHPRGGAPGDTVQAVAQWRAIEPLPAASYKVAVRFDRPLPGAFDPPRIVSKPMRKLLEKIRRERYRFRSDHLPAGGQYGVDLWDPGEVVRDSFKVVIPRDAADGRYDVRITMLKEPHYPNFRLSDYFFDEDYYHGVLVGDFVVLRPGHVLTDDRPRRGH